MKNEIFELWHNDVLKFQGSEYDCRWKLLRSQPMSIEWATTKDGWQIKKRDFPKKSIQNIDIKNSNNENV